MPVPEQFCSEDLNEILQVLNYSFSFKETHPDIDEKSDFEANLPIMWTGEHDYGSKHIGIRENGKIVSLLGVYPLPTVIAGKEILMGTIGNVGSIREARGKGYMKQIMTAALEAAEKQGFVAARLGGLRSRYNRYNFDHAGKLFICHLTRRNVNEYGDIPELHFKEIRPDDSEAICFARACQRRAEVYVIRETDTVFYATLRAWRNVPVIALDKQENPVGYLSTSPDGKTVAEWGTDGSLTGVDLCAAWMKSSEKLPEITLEVVPYDRETLKAVFSHCESWTETAASMFHVFKWDELTEALMRLAVKTGGLAEGELTFGIEGWGTLHMKVSGNECIAEKTDAEPAFVLSPLEATGWMFGDLGCLSPIQAGTPESSWFPLPLSWNGHDRV